MLDQVAIHEAETYLSRLLNATDRDGEIAITRNGRPVATVTPPATAEARRQVRGVWRGIPSLSQQEFDACNDEIARAFGILE